AGAPVEGDVFADEAAEHGEGAVHALVEIDDAGGDGLAAREGEELADELGGAFGGGAGLGEVVAGVRRGEGLRGGGVGVGDDDAERGGAVAAGAAGEAAGGCHRVGRAQAAVEGRAFGAGAHAGAQPVFAAD